MINTFQIMHLWKYKRAKSKIPTGQRIYCRLLPVGVAYLLKSAASQCQQSVLRLQYHYCCFYLVSTRTTDTPSSTRRYSVQYTQYFTCVESVHRWVVELRWKWSAPWRSVCWSASLWWDWVSRSFMSRDVKTVVGANRVSIELFLLTTFYKSVLHHRISFLTFLLSWSTPPIINISAIISITFAQVNVFSVPAILLTKGSREDQRGCEGGFQPDHRWQIGRSSELFRV